MSSDEESLHQSREKFIVERASEANTNEINSDFFGPALPPHLLEKQTPEKKGDKGKTYGPILPEHLQGEKTINDIESSAPEKRNERLLIGPDIPEYLKRNPPSDAVKEDSDPPSEVDEGFGPSTNLMAAADEANYHIYISRQSSTKKDEGEPSVEREEWMTQLPEKKTAALGLSARQFKTRMQTDKESDSSVWTETPADKDKKDTKKDHKAILEMNRLKERDKEMEKLARKAEKKLRKKESLLEMYFKNKKKKKKKEAKEKKGKNDPVERRPFDRNIDLQVSRFDESKARAFFNRNQFLNDRFAPGQSKFL